MIYSIFLKGQMAFLKTYIFFAALHIPITLIPFIYKEYELSHPMRKCHCYGDSQWRSLNGFVALVTSLRAGAGGPCLGRASVSHSEEVEASPACSQESRDQDQGMTVRGWAPGCDH